MTCVIALKDNDKVYMGHDSYLGSNGWHVEYKQPKVIKCHNMYLGFTGSPRAIQLIQYHLSIRSQIDSENDLFYLVTVFADGVRKIFKDYGYSWVNSNHEYTEDCFIIVYKNDIYKMDSNYQITQPLDNFICIGAGDELAVGAMSALDKLEPKKRIKQSLKITGKYSNFVISPYKVLECSV